MFLSINLNIEKYLKPNGFEPKNEGQMGDLTMQQTGSITEKRNI